MKLSCWNLDLGAVSGEELFDWCLREHSVNRMLVAVRLEQHGGRWRALVPGSTDHFQARFAAHIREQFLASGWPGTESIGQPGLMYLVEFNLQVKELTLQIEPDLRRWSIDDKPPLPEDICLFRMGDSHPIFVSVIHEGDAWLFTNKKPTIKGVSLGKAVDTDRLRQELIAFPGKYFCRLWRGKLKKVDKRLLPKRK